MTAESQHILSIPIKNKVNSLQGLVPSIFDRENVPPVLAVRYSPLTPTSPNLPKVSFSSIYNHMILRHTESNRPINNSKGLDKAAKHFEAGDISNIEYSIIDDTLMYIKAQCTASMKKQRYSVFLCIGGKEKVSYAYCQCPVGLAQSCSHIGALLFALNSVQRSNNDDSCTSKPCKWDVPRAMKIKRIPLSEWNLSRPRVHHRGGEEEHIKKPLDFDPRHPTQREFDLNRSLNQLKELKKLFPNTGMSQLWHIPDDTPEAAREEIVYTTVDPRELSMQSLVLCEENLPLPTAIDHELAVFIEKRTKGQRTSQLWHDLHRGRITSSVFGAVLHAGQNPTSLINQILHGSNLSKYRALPKALQWGIDHEHQARNDYITLQNVVTNLSVEQAGLTINPSKSFLGASSDGWVIDHSLPDDNNKGCLEIKCPYSIQKTVITDWQVIDLIQNKDFCIEMTEEGSQLKKSHPYYAQIQGEMALMGVSWCDFVFWTNATQGNCFIQRVHLDSEFVSQMKPKLEEFFIIHILPYYKN